MQCRSCGAEIAEKALICYRCGTATTEAKHKPVPLPPRGSRSGLVASVLAIVILAAAGFALVRTQGGGSSGLVTGIVVAVAVVVVALRAYARRR